jgi:hypothetical protein
MSRNDLGQFEPGTSGNPRGRPRKKPQRIHPELLRRKFFEASETLVPIMKHGKREMVPASFLIEKQLALKAASGDMRAILEWMKMYQRHTLEYDKEQLKFAEHLRKAEERIRKFPEDVTDQFKTATRMMRSMIDPTYLL